MREPYAELLAEIDQREEALVQELIEWSLINSGSTHLAGLASMLVRLKDSFSSLLGPGDTVQVIDIPDLEVIGSDGRPQSQKIGQALLVRKRPEHKNRVFLCGHMDTVFPADHPFQACQWLDSDTLNGPGVADMKGGILVMRTALETLESHTVAENIGWDVLLTPDEEIGSIGSGSLFKAFSASAFGMIFEPSLPGGEFVGERKGSGNFTIVVRGQSAHAGREFYKGKNAIVKLSDIISQLHGLNDPNQSTTLNVGLIEGGQALNVVPDLAIAKFNIRVSDTKAAERILEKVQLILNAHKQQGYEVTLHGQLTRPAKPMDDSQKRLFAALQTCCDDLSLPMQVIATGGCCDGNNLKALGIPNVDTLGVRGGHIHSDKEFMVKQSLVERSKLSALLLLKYAAGDFQLLK